MDVWTTRADILSGLVLSFLLAATFVAVSHVANFPHLQESVGNQLALIRGQPFVFDGKSTYIEPHYNRILFPVLLSFSREVMVNWTDVQLFLLLRFLTSAACFFAIYLAAIDRMAPADTLLICLAAVFCLITQVPAGWIQPGDIIDLTLCFFMFLWLLEGRFAAGLVIACVTAVNRETGAFAGIAYFVLNVGHTGWVALILRVVLLGVVPFLLAVAVRRIVLPGTVALVSGGQTFWGWEANFRDVLEAVTAPRPTGWLMLLLAMLVVPWLVAFVRRPQAIGFGRMLAVFALIFGISGYVGIIREVRVFLPCVSFIFACVVARGSPR